MKNKVMKRMLAGALSAVMIFTSLPANFLAEEVSTAAEEAVISQTDASAMSEAGASDEFDTAAGLTTENDAGLPVNVDLGELVETITESHDEIADSLDEFEAIEEFIVDEDPVVEEEELFGEAEMETDSLEEEWIVEDTAVQADVPEREVQLDVDNKELKTGDEYTFTVNASDAKWIEVFYDVEHGYNWKDRWDEETVTQTRSYGHSGTYKLVARAHYSDDDQDYKDSDPVEIQVTAPNGCLSINLPDDLPGSLTRDDSLRFTLIRPDGAERFEAQVWYDRENEPIFLYEESKNAGEENEITVEVEPEKLSQLANGQVIKVRVYACAPGMDDAEDYREIPVIEADQEKVKIELSQHEALVNEDIQIKVSPVSSADTIKAVRFWDTGGFWEWGREMKPDDDRDWFDEDGNFSVRHSWDRAGKKTVYAWVTFDGETWYTTGTEQIDVTKYGNVEEFTFGLNQTEVTRGAFLTVTYSEAENADHYWVDIEKWDDQKKEWNWFDNAAHTDKAGSTIFGTMGLEPGQYRLTGQASGLGYERREANEGPVTLTVKDAEIPAGDVLLTTDKTALNTGEEFAFSIYAQGAKKIELFFNFEGEGDWQNWSNEWEGESRSESRSYGHSGTYKLVARAHYSDADDDIKVSEPVIMKVRASTGQQIAISRPVDLPISLTEGKDLEFTVTKPDKAEGYRVDVWYDHEDENDHSDTSLFHWDSNDEDTVPESRTVQITSDELSQVERNQVKVSVEAWAAGYDDLREEWVLPLLEQAATEKVRIELSRSKALVNEDIHIKVSPVSDADTIRAIRFWDDGGFWEWGREMKPDDDRDRDRFDEDGNFSAEHSWDRPGSKTVYALVTFDENSEDGDGNDQRTWYTTQIKQVNVTKNGNVGDFTFSLNKTEVARGEFLTATYTEAKNADHYWIDIEQWDDDKKEWNWFDNAAHADAAGPTTFGTAELEPGKYRIYGSASGVGYERSEANDGAPIELTVTKEEIPEDKILFDVDKRTLDTQEPYKLTAYAPGARWIEVFYDVDNGYEWNDWWGGESFTDRRSYGHSGTYSLMARAHYYDVDDEGEPLHQDENGNPVDETIKVSDVITITVTASTGKALSISLPDSLPGALTPGDDLTFTVTRPEGAEHFGADVWYDRDDEGVTLFHQDMNPGEGDTIKVTVTSQQLSQLENGQVVKIRAYAGTPGMEDADDHREIPVLEADDGAVNIEVSAEKVTVGEEVHITVSPVDDSRTIRALRIWDDGGFWEWGDEIRPDDERHRDWFDGEGNFSVEHRWDSAGNKVVYAQVTFDDFEDGNEDENGNDRRTWYTSEPKTVTVTKEGDVGPFTFSLDQESVPRGEFVTVTYEEAAYADHYWVDIEALHEPDAEDNNRYWYMVDNGAHTDRAGEEALGTAGLEPGTYRIYAFATGYGYEKRRANNGQPVQLTVKEAQVPGGGILLNVDKREPITQEDFSVSAYAPEAKWIEVYFDYENNKNNRAWRDGDSITEQRGYSSAGSYKVVAIAHYFETDEHGDPIHQDDEGNPTDDTIKQAEVTITVTAPNGNLKIDLPEEAFLDSLTWDGGLCYTAKLPENAVYLETGAWYEGDEDPLFSESNEDDGSSRIDICIPEDMLKTDGDEPLGIWIYASAPGFNDVETVFKVPTAKINNLIDQAAVAAAREAVDSLPRPAKESDAVRIAEIKKIVNSLSGPQKALLDEGEFAEMLGKISAAESEVTAAKEAREKAEADQAAANSVIAKINALPQTPGAADEAAVSAARAAYDALSADQKNLVNAATGSKLPDAETAVASAKAEAAKAAEAEKARAEAAAKFALNVANGSSVPLQVKKSSKNVMVEEIADGDSLASATSANANIVKASVSGNRVVLKAGKKTGKAAVTVTSAMGGKVTFTVKVQKGKVTTKGVKVLKAKITMKKGEKLDLKAKLNPITSPDKMKFSTASKKIAAVSGKGIVTAKGKGKVKITIKAGKKQKVVTVTVTN